MRNPPHPSPRAFSHRAHVYICVRVKKFDTARYARIMHASMATREYYLKNRKARLKYQREYYEVNKARIARKREVADATDPELRDKRRAYQRAYYRKFRARILIMRAKQYALKKARRSKSSL